MEKRKGRTRKKNRRKGRGSEGEERKRRKGKAAHENRRATKLNFCRSGSVLSPSTVLTYMWPSVTIRQCMTKTFAYVLVD